MPGFVHAHVASVLGGAINTAFHRSAADANGPGGWWILDRPELRFPPDVVVPDVAGWRRDRMPVLVETSPFTTPPDWVCEVVSPNSDRGRTMRIYARETIPFLWIVAPLDRTLDVYQLHRDRWVVASTHAGGELARALPFDAIELDMARWWMPTGTAVVRR